MAEQRSRGIITDITGLTDEEILESVHQNAFESDYYKHCMNVLQLRSMQRSAQASKRLVWATWCLFGATLSLLLGTIPQLVEFIKSW
jgi:hypothetical protein